MAACWPLQMPPTPKAVLISLADNANDHGVCWPSISTICARTCFGKTAVIEAIQWLETAGFLVADRENGRHTKYQIIPAGRDLFSPPVAAKPVRVANRSAKRTGTATGPDPSASRKKPVRQADTNRKEPSGTVTGARGTRLPKDWQPNESAKLWFAEEYPRCELKGVVDEFRDYWVAQPGGKGVRADWDATFRNSVRKFPPKPRAGPAPAKAGPSPMSGPARRMTDDERNKTLAKHMPEIAKQLGITSV